MEKNTIKPEIVDTVNLSGKKAYFSQACSFSIYLQYKEIDHFSTISCPYYYYY